MVNTTSGTYGEALHGDLGNLVVDSFHDGTKAVLRTAHTVTHIINIMIQLFIRNSTELGLH